MVALCGSELRIEHDLHADPDRIASLLGHYNIDSRLSACDENTLNAGRLSVCLTVPPPIEYCCSGTVEQRAGAIPDRFLGVNGRDGAQAGGENCDRCGKEGNGQVRGEDKVHGGGEVRERRRWREVRGGEEDEVTYGIDSQYNHDFFLTLFVSHICTIDHT